MKTEITFSPGRREQCRECFGTGVFVNFYYPTPRSMGHGKSVCEHCEGTGYREFIYLEGDRYDRRLDANGKVEYLRA